jgi:hypothetical protein
MKKLSTIQEISLGLFSGAYESTAMELDDKTSWVRQHMRGSYEDIFRECLIMRIYGIVHGIRNCTACDQVRDEVERVVMTLLLSWLFTKNDYAEPDSRKEHRNVSEHFRQYDLVIDAMLNNDGSSASRILFHSIKGILRPTGNIDRLDLLKDFMDLVLSYSEQVSAHLNEFRDAI